MFTGLTQPTAMRFAADGRVFVAEKSGIIKVFDNLDDNTPTVFADLRTQVHNFWDRGLLGLALDPQFPSNPWVYVLYTRDAEIGGTAPRWGSPGQTSDPCPTPPGATQDGCVASGRLSRLQASGNVMVGQEQVLIDDWCQQYPSHSVGDLASVRTARSTRVAATARPSGGQRTTASWEIPPNPCGDPPVPVGGSQTIPSAEGGALRSQDLRTPNDPTTLDGTIIRVDPATGAALPDNPMASSTDPNARRIIAYGLRNPFRFTIRPGTDELWIGDVGWNTWEEIDRLVNPTDATVENFGWPCYEGNGGSRPGMPLGSPCARASTRREAGQSSRRPIPTSTRCVSTRTTTASPAGSVTGVAFMPMNSVSYPAAYRGALFFADYSRKCIWVATAGANGQPDFAQPSSLPPSCRPGRSGARTRQQHLLRRPRRNGSADHRTTHRRKP